MYLDWLKTVTHPHALLGGEQEGWVSDLGWRQFRTLLEGKAEKYGRDFRVISRWEPISQVCSCCGIRGGKLDLSVREWECLNCSIRHDHFGEWDSQYISRGRAVRDIKRTWRQA